MIKEFVDAMGSKKLLAEKTQDEWSRIANRSDQELNATRSSASTSSQRDRKRSPSIIYISDSSSDSHKLTSNNQTSSTNTSRYDTVYISDFAEETRSGGAVESSQPDIDIEEERAIKRMLQSERGNGVDGSDYEVQDDELFSDSESEGMESDADKISKPVGEAGRPRSGGYNLEKALNWSPERHRFC
ncbi:hypothetical protein AAF712_007387 [Marasmius tenuissimus]|uniref:Uncharacterized protein n=1 Tax=Marasmius tenuissimus TaxID=585030 RepID=A0ABR2ZX10_9AGAR